MLRKIVSEREEELPRLIIGRMLKIVEEDKSYLSLGPGEPDFDAPPNVIRAAKKALDRGLTHYSPTGGREDLIEAVVEKAKKENRIKAGPENVVITTGSTEGIMLSLMCTMDPGEAIMIPDPGFLAYRPTVEVLNGEVISVFLHEDDGFQLNLERTARKIVPEQTRAIIINTPANPTGAVYTRETLEEVADFAVQNDLLIISDEAYEKFVYGGAKHVSIGSFNGLEDRVITLHSFSKTFAMPGFRVGYAIAPEKLAEAMKKVHIFTTLSTPTISQVAAVEALKHSRRHVERMLKEYDRRRKMIIRRLNEIPGVRCIKPHGAFYAFPNISSFGMSSLKFAERMLEKKVLVMPGTEFGAGGEGFIRCSYATDYKKIEAALDRMEGALEHLKK